MSGKHIMLIFCAGGLGALSRFALTALVNKMAGSGFPWGTLAVNILGCFIFGLIWAYLNHQTLPDTTRLIMLVGFVGSFTTFSSYIFDSYALGHNQMLLALVNVVSQVVIGFICLWLGIRAMTWICGGKPI